MAKQIPPDVLMLKRTQPVQGKPVDVRVEWNGQWVGNLKLPFTAWIKFNRLLSHGVEMDKKEDHKLNVKVKVEGIDAEPAMELIPQPVVTQRPVPVPYHGGISNFAAEDEDEDIKAAEQQARLDAAEEAIHESQERQQEQLVRSLRPANKTEK